MTIADTAVPNTANTMIDPMLAKKLPQEKGATAAMKILPEWTCSHSLY